MVIKVSSVYRVDIQKHDHQQTHDGAKKKEEIKFKDVLAKALKGLGEKSIGYKR
jgi:hypothetical protein